MNLTPYQLGILLNIYVGAEIGADKHAPIYRDTMIGLCGRGLIENGNDDPALMPEWLPTEKLNVMLYHMLSTPDPVQSWEVPARDKTRGENG